MRKTCRNLGVPWQAFCEGGRLERADGEVGPLCIRNKGLSPSLGSIGAGTSCRIVLVGGGGASLKYPHIHQSGATTVGEAVAFGRRCGSWGGTELSTAADAPRACDGGPLSWRGIWMGATQQPL